MDNCSRYSHIMYTLLFSSHLPSLILLSHTLSRHSCSLVIHFLIHHLCHSPPPSIGLIGCDWDHTYRFPVDALALKDVEEPDQCLGDPPRPCLIYYPSNKKPLFVEPQMTPLDPVSHIYYPSHI